MPDHQVGEPPEVAWRLFSPSVARSRVVSRLGTVAARVARLKADARVRRLHALLNVMRGCFRDDALVDHLRTEQSRRMSNVGVHRPIELSPFQRFECSCMQADKMHDHAAGVGANETAQRRANDRGRTFSSRTRRTILRAGPCDRVSAGTRFCRQLHSESPTEAQMLEAFGQAAST
jgi:hypothetical protein